MDVVKSCLSVSTTPYSARLSNDKGAGFAQRGVYAVEFGLVFLIFFLVLYAILTYGMIFAAQQSLNHAAEDSARSALAWGADPSARIAVARQRATDATQWIADMGGEDSELDIKVCYSSSTDPDSDVGNCASPPEAGQIKVDIRYSYQDAPLIPTLASIGVPKYLYAEATVSLDIASQATASAEP